MGGGVSVVGYGDAAAGQLSTAAREAEERRGEGMSEIGAWPSSKRDFLEFKEA